MGEQDPIRRERSGPRRVLQTVFAALAGACLPIYLAAVAVNAEVEDSANWWPYPWLWAVAAVLLISTAFLLFSARESGSSVAPRGDLTPPEAVTSSTSRRSNADDRVTAWEDYVGIAEPWLLRDGATEPDDRRETNVSAVVRNNSSLAIQNVEVRWLNPDGVVLERRTIPTIGPGREKAFARPRSLDAWGPIRVEAQFIDREEAVRVADHSGVKTHIGSAVDHQVDRETLTTKVRSKSALATSLWATTLGFVALAVSIVIYPSDRTLSLAIGSPGLLLFIVAGVLSLLYLRRSAPVAHSAIGWAVIRAAQGMAILGFIALEIGLALNGINESVAVAISTPGVLLLMAAGGVGLVAKLRGRARRTAQGSST